MDASPLKRKRVVKACFSCRKSKLSCDGKRPCSRCARSHLACEFEERPKDPILERFQNLESELVQLQQKLSTLTAPLIAGSGGNSSALSPIHNSAEGIDPEALTHSSKQNAPFAVRITDNDSVISLVRTTSHSTSTPWGQDASWEEPGPSTPRRLLSRSVPKKQRCDFKLSSASCDDFVTCLLVTERDAVAWFQRFFGGCDRFVPAFSADYDSYSSVRARSPLLFDTIVTFGSRGAGGSAPQDCQRLQSLLREKISFHVLAPTGSSSATLEAVQALLIHACYFSNGWLVIATAIRFALELDLPESVESLLTKVMHRKVTGLREIDEEERILFRKTRIFLALFNIELILSLESGKSSLLTLTTSPRRLRVLREHSLASLSDLRLFAQVELNVMRIANHDALSRVSIDHNIEEIGIEVASVVKGAVIDLHLWKDEWTNHVTSEIASTTRSGASLTTLHIQIQHEWALMTLHLLALTASGVENIAVMTESQYSVAYAAKTAADRHLDLMLLRNDPVDSSTTVSGSCPYLEDFRHAMDFVWAKCAFSVFLVLRLSILLQDPVDKLMERIQKARQLLIELENAGGSEVRYYHILAFIVEKCERVHRELQEQQRRQDSIQERNGQTYESTMDNATSSIMQSNAGESEAGRDFAAYVPQEFLFEWHFPGLNLCYTPFNWQDLFADF